MIVELSVRVAVHRLPLSGASIKALQRTDRYDHIVFTSKNARKFFAEELKALGIRPPARSRTIQVGPRADLLKYDFKGKRILFPRSAIAPHDIVRRLRSRGVIVCVVPLYTTSGIPLTSAQRESLLKGKVRQLYFKSPSGVLGLLRQLRGGARRIALGIPARCIGDTTAQAARQAGFRVFIK